ncbi:MAG: FAD-dependent oxidoreductase [Sandaracinaceae bacterium]|nr:FAD-dependent oxidoreductase [Sandaracinaceae bacterium]
MRTSRTSYDVAVVGGGPVGAVTAIAHAREGARVLVLEADPRAAHRFAGEWLHPTGVAVLDELRIGRLERASARSGYGFVILPDDEGGPIEMPYTNGVALSAEHGSIVEALREAARGVSGVEIVVDARAVAIDGSTLRVERRKTGETFEVRAGRIVGADGRKSMVRQSLRAEESSALLSYMASVELRGVELPREGFGHVVLGGRGRRSSTGSRTTSCEAASTCRSRSARARAPASSCGTASRPSCRRGSAPRSASRSRAGPAPGPSTASGRAPSSAAATWRWSATPSATSTR